MHTATRAANSDAVQCVADGWRGSARSKLRSASCHPAWCAGGIRCTSQTDRDSRVTNFAYDNLSRLTSEQWMSGGSAIYTASYVYDAASELTSAADASSAYAYAYDAAGRVTAVDNNTTPNIPRPVRFINGRS